MKIHSKVIKAIKEGGVLLLAKRSFSFLKPKSIASSFSQPLTNGLPDVNFVIKPINEIEKPGDIEIAKRIITAFNLANLHEKQFYKEKDDAWDIIQKGPHESLFKILVSGNPEKLAEHLSMLHLNGSSYGISGFNQNEYYSYTARMRRENIALIKDKIVCLAEAVGAIPYRYFGSNLYEDTDELVKKINSKLGVDITPPCVDGGLVKVSANGADFALRDLWSFYTAWRIKDISDCDKKIAEIGAGLGWSAFFSYQFGCRNYTIFDLPQLNVIQAWCLIKSGVEVVLYGESASERKVKIFPWWEFKDDDEFYITINVDSFPEMAPEIVQDYLQKIKRNTTNYLLSINQEKLLVQGDISVAKTRLLLPKYVEEAGGFKRVYRFPFWLRNGYIEELYKIN